MGLDMYLSGEKFLWTNYEDKSKCPRKLVGDIFPNVRAEVSYVVFQLGYWRKANQIHKWFVDNVQDGVDDCGEYCVSEKSLLELKEACLKALDGDTSKLPPQSGCFFGSTSIDEYYFEDIKHTLRIIDKALDFIQNHGSVMYQASW